METSATTGIAHALTQMADGLSRLFTEHLALARLELARDARLVGSDLGRLAAFIPLAIVGYAFVCGAAALGLSRWMGTGGAVLAVGAFNLFAGVWGVARTARRLGERDVFVETRRALQHTTAPEAEVSR